MSSTENPSTGAPPPDSPDSQAPSVEAGVPLATEPPPMPGGLSDAGFVDPVIAIPPAKASFPPWGFGGLAMILAMLFFASIISGFVVTVFAATLPAFKHAKAIEIAARPVVQIGTMFGSYVITMWFIYRLMVVRYQVGFLDGLHWHWPASRWPRFLALGVVLSLAVQMASTHLPIPKDMPIDTYYQSASGAWAMALFGTLVAPFVEEVLFRGLLYPVLAKRLGLIAGVALTGLAFALVHSGQLAQAWGPLSMLLVVGLVLTIVRARTNSVAASMLVHTAYNGTIFVLVLAQTNFFRHL